MCKVWLSALYTVIKMKSIVDAFRNKDKSTDANHCVILLSSPAGNQVCVLAVLPATIIIVGIFIMLKLLPHDQNQRHTFDRVLLVLGCVAMGLFQPLSVNAHGANEPVNVTKILQELQTQGRDLRDIQALLEAREADQIAQQLSQEAEDLSQRPPARAEKAAGVPEGGDQAVQAADAKRWQQMLVRQSKFVKALQGSERPAVTVVHKLQSVAPDLPAVLDAMFTHADLTPELRQLATLALRRAEVVPDWIAWLDKLNAPDVQTVEEWVLVLHRQGHLKRAISMLRTPLMQGGLNLSRGRRAALASAFSVLDAAELSALKLQLRADLEKLFIYGGDRIYTYNLLSPIYTGAVDQKAAWSDLIQRAWRQSRHSAKEEHAFAPLAARMGNQDALHVWVADHLSDDRSRPGVSPLEQLDNAAGGADDLALDRVADVLTSEPEASDKKAALAASKLQAHARFSQQLANLIEHPEETDIVYFYQANRGRFVFDANLGKYVLR